MRVEFAGEEASPYYSEIECSTGHLRVVFAEYEDSPQLLKN